MAEGVGHRQDRQAEGKRNTRKAYPRFREFRCEYGAAAPSENEPESTEHFREKTLFHLHVALRFANIRITLEEVMSHSKTRCTGSTLIRLIVRVSDRSMTCN
jgi:hypothetical protein